MIRRLLIANRGEIAVRIIARAASWASQPGRVLGGGRSGRARRSGGRAIGIGPAPARESYLSIPAIMRAAQGVGRRRDPSRLRVPVRERGVRRGVRGRRARLRRPARRRHRADGIEDRGAAADAGGRRAGRARRDAGRSVGRGPAAGDRAGRPAGAGQGVGRRRRQRHARALRDSSAALEAIQAARREARPRSATARCTSSGCIERPHHVEVQVFGDAHGDVVHLFERECSVQRRHQKVIEESPSPAIDAGAARADDRGRPSRPRAPRRLPQRRHGRVPRRPVGWESAAPFYFLEMNTRLQVEHPVTEHVAGVDLVRAQLLVAVGRAAALAPGRDRASAATRSKRASTPRIPAADSCRRPAASRSTASRGCPALRIDSGVGRGQRGAGLLRSAARQGDRVGRNPRPRDRAPRRPRSRSSSSSASAPTSRSCYGCSTIRLSVPASSTPASSIAKARSARSVRLRRLHRLQPQCPAFLA